MADKSLTRKHHEKSTFCYSRPSYRDANFEKAVKVYTVNLESKYIIVNGVSSIGVAQELIDKFSSFGSIEEYRKLDDYPNEDFTEAYLIKYEKINNSRYVKRKMDNKSFFGGILHICYAPEFESVEECRQKLEERRKIIARKTRQSHSRLNESSTDDAPKVLSVGSTSTATQLQSTNTISTIPLIDPPPLTTALSPNSTLWNFPHLPPPPSVIPPSSLLWGSSRRVPDNATFSAASFSKNVQYAASTTTSTTCTSTIPLNDPPPLTTTLSPNTTLWNFPQLPPPPSVIPPPPPTWGSSRSVPDHATFTALSHFHQNLQYAASTQISRIGQSSAHGNSSHIHVPGTTHIKRPYTYNGGQVRGSDEQPSKSGVLHGKARNPELVQEQPPQGPSSSKKQRKRI